MMQQKNKVNYQHVMEKVLEANAGQHPRLFLHACCAPCSSYVMEYLSQYFDITIFFYNPNIATETEYMKRAEELKRLIQEMKLDISVIIPEYRHKDFLEIARGLEQEPERGKRCKLCYRLRLEATAQAAKAQKEKPYDYICTTLSISPLKDAEALNEIGVQIAEQAGLVYLPSDFKKKGGYQRSLVLSKEHALYRQNYCGCEFSMREAMLRENR